MADFNLIQLYTAAFVQAPYANLDALHAVVGGGRWDKVEGGRDPGGRIGLLGSVIYLPCKLGELELPNEPLIEISGEKLIVETVIDGNNGTFKELFSTGDYSITIRGIAIDEKDPDNYPESIIRDIREVCERPKHVPITNALTSLFNIEHVAIRSYRFPAVPGELGAQAYEIECKSDREFKLRITA